MSDAKPTLTISAIAEFIRSFPTIKKVERVIPAHTDLTSMGIEFTVPAKTIMVDAPTTFTDLAEAVAEQFQDDSLEDPDATARIKMLETVARYAEHRPNCNAKRALPFEIRSGEVKCSCGLNKARTSI